MSKGWSTWASSALILLILSVACSASPSPQATQAPAAKPATTAAPAATTSAAPAAANPVAAAPTAAAPAAKPQGTLKIAFSSLAGETQDPYLTSGPATPFQTMIFDSLVGVTPDGQDVGTAEGLATKWAQSADGLSWTFTLRKGAKWDQNFGEATAEDVKFSLERVMKDGAKNVQTPNLRAGIKEIVAVDPNTVRIDTKYPYVTLPYDLSYFTYSTGPILSKKALEQMGEKAYWASPVGSGPYRMVKHEIGLYYQYQARTDYWGGTPRYENVYIYGVPEEATRVAMLKRGELDIAEVSMSQLNDLKTAGFQLADKADRFQLEMHMFNQWDKPFDNQNVRLAMNLAVNRQEMLNTLFGGRGTILGGNFMTWTIGGKKDMPTYPYDPTKAKQLLADAGYPNGFDSSMALIQERDLPIIGPALAGYYQAVGVRIKIMPMDTANWSTTWGNQKWQSPTVGPYDLGNVPFQVSTYRGFYHAKGNRALTRDPELTSFLDTAAKAKNLDELSGYQAKFQQMLYDKTMLVPLLGYGQWFAAGPKTDIKGWNVGSHSSYDVGLNQILMSH